MGVSLISKKQLSALVLIVLGATLFMSVSISALNAATVVSRVSTDSAGVEANGATGNSPAVSRDGRYITFTSSATNLVVGDSNAVDDTFLKDTVTGTTTRISTDSSGVQANGASVGSPAISADGRYVVFSSGATNLVAGDSNAFGDVFVKDTQTGTTTRVSTSSVGVQANSVSLSYWTSISADGRYVVFLSFATNLVASDTNATSDMFVKDLQTGTTIRVSTDSTGTQGNAAVVNGTAAISADGRYVSFTSTATNLVASDTNAVADIFRKDIITNTTLRISTDSSGAQAGAASSFSAISADGRYVVFDSTATNLVTGDTNAVGDVFVKDTQTSATTRISTDSAGVQGNGASLVPIISADGRYVVYRSDASNLVASDTNAARDHFLKDNLSDITVRVSTATGGLQGNNTAVGGVTISDDNRQIAFASNATNLITGDTNAVIDIFYRFNPLLLVTANDDYSTSPITPGGNTPSVLANDLFNAAPANPADYTLSLLSNGGLASLVINADGSLTVPVNAPAGTYTITYQACEVVSPGTCYSATATFIVVHVPQLATTGTNTHQLVIASFTLILLATMAIKASYYFRRAA